MEGSLLWLDELRLEHLPLVGGKLARLGQLRAKGLQVPDGFAVTVQAFDAFLSGGVRRELELLLAQPADGVAGNDRLAGAARQLIEAEELPGWLVDRVAEAYAHLDRRAGLESGMGTAVRSSGVAEDGDESSFAGQFDTYLGIKSVPAVLNHIRKCWASQYTARALDYRSRRGLPMVMQGLAVGVLQLIDARSAGVVFTLNPIDGDRGYAVVEGNWGFGETVVSGLVTPDHWVVDKHTGDVVEEVVGAKAVWSVFDDGAGRVIEQPAPASQVSKPCLGHEEVRHLVGLAVDIEEREGCPQDVEWAIARGLDPPQSIFLLQHRPETVWSSQVVAAPTRKPGKSIVDKLWF